MSIFVAFLDNMNFMDFLIFLSTYIFVPFNSNIISFSKLFWLIVFWRREKRSNWLTFSKKKNLQKSHLNRAGNINLRPISTSGSMPKNLMASSASAAASEWQYEPTFRPGSMSRVQTSFAVVTNPATSHSQQHNVRIWSIQILRNNVKTKKDYPKNLLCT